MHHPRRVGLAACALLALSCSARQHASSAPRGGPAGETEAAVAGPQGSGATEEPAPTQDAEVPLGVAPCDEYLRIYRECERRLEADIERGDRRAYEAEREWLRFMLTTDEAPGVPAACEQMLVEISAACG